MTSYNISLTPTVAEDLHTLFEFQRDAAAVFLAAFTAKDPHDKEAYIGKYSRLLADPGILMRTIRADGVIAGSVSGFLLAGEAEITFWIDRRFWGQGVATAALAAFLRLEDRRPIRGRVAYDNIGSQRVMEKCGFVRTGTDRGFANARNREIEEYIYQLAGWA